MDMPVSLRPDDMADLCLRFAGEVLNSLKPCLITVITHGSLSQPLDVTVKVNYEDTVFGLNLLNRLVAIVQWHSTCKRSSPVSFTGVAGCGSCFGDFWNVLETFNSKLEDIDSLHSPFVIFWC